MQNYFYILAVILFLGMFSGFCQENDLKLYKVDTVAVKINPLAPAKAAFYSALFPGLGQAYNKKYWKIPLVYGAIGTGVYSYAWNRGKYNEYRDAYKQRLLEGIQSTDKFNKKAVGGLFLSEEKLIAAQKQFQRQRDLSILITALIYVLNIVDANVDGHLKQFNVNDKLTAKPEIYKNNADYSHNIGITLNYNF